LGGGRPCKRVTSGCMWDVVLGKSNGNPECIHDCINYNPCTPPFVLEKENSSINPSPSFVCDRIYVHWREREHEELDILLEEDTMVVAMLK
jgi:hypothetical protein